jgi:hypothetical protein
MWTMIGGGLGLKKEDSMRPMASTMPKGVQLVNGTNAQRQCARRRTLLATCYTYLPM